MELGPAPEGTTGIAMELTCLTPGRFELGAGGASLSCTAADVNAAAITRPTTWGVLDRLPGQNSLTIRTEPENRWRLTAKYVNQETTAWGHNVEGDTYGVQNENGTPDLVAVMATNGRSGYAYRTDLEEADGTAAGKTFKSPQDALDWQEARQGKSFSVPVYDIDGKTVIGEFVIR